jgi:hypothetical protein
MDKKEYDRLYYEKNKELIQLKRKLHYIETRDEYLKRNKINYLKRKHASYGPIIIEKGKVIKFD